MSRRGYSRNMRKTEKIVETELKTQKRYTKNQILHGFWLATDVVVFVTNDKKTNVYWLEMFRYGEH